MNYKLSVPYNYEDDYNYSINDQIKFWDEVAMKYVVWDKKYESVIGENEINSHHPYWFKGGLLNTCYNVLDVHINDKKFNSKQEIAIIYECPFLKKSLSITYYQLYERVCEFSRVLLNLNICKQDKVLMLMSNSIEITVAMLSCSRVGATFSVLFEGYSVNGIIDRINTLKPKLIILSNYGIVGNEVISISTKIKKSLEKSIHKPDSVITLKRNDNSFIKEPLILETISNIPIIEGSLDWDELVILVKSNPFYGYIPVESTHPVYVIYTSGTTGSPKPIIRGTASNLVAVKYHEGKTKTKETGKKVYFSTSLFGWVSNHNRLYATLSFRDTFLIYEGGCGNERDYLNNIWQVIEKHKVNVYSILPTIVKYIMKKDPNATSIKKYNLSSLDYFLMGGEIVGDSVYDFIVNKLGVPIYNHFGQTESCFGVITSYNGLIPIQNGMIGKPSPSVKLSILSKEGIEQKDYKIGELSIKLPLPPGYLLTLFNDNEKFKKYFTSCKQYYKTGDLGYRDKNGYYKIVSRDDDTISIASDKIQLNTLDELVLKHPLVLDCCCVGINHEILGQVPIALLVLQPTNPNTPLLTDMKELENQINQIIIENYEPISVLRFIIQVEKLPKTNTGKKLTTIFKHLFNDENYQIPNSMDDIKLIHEIYNIYLNFMKIK